MPPDHSRGVEAAYDERLRQILDRLIDAYPHGRTARQLGHDLGMRSLEVSGKLRYLAGRGLVDSFVRRDAQLATWWTTAAADAAYRLYVTALSHEGQEADRG